MSRLMRAIGAGLCALWLISTPGVAAGPQAAMPAADPDSFARFVAGVKADALARGLSDAVVTQALDGLTPLEVVIERDRTQAETVLTIDQYLDRRLTSRLVRTARQRAAQHRTLLRRVAARHDVPARYLVAIWGLESNFGRFSGVRPTIQALATLAWEGRRGAFFRSELLDALEILDRGYIAPAALKGSWAGAMGQVQFMPSSYLKFAVDFDGDGRRDIWTSPGDIFASIANYLGEHGWDDRYTWGREVRVPGGDPDAFAVRLGLRETGCRAERQMTAARPLAEWQALGVRTSGGGALPRAELDASLVPAGRRAYLVYGNYQALLEYNCAHSYALAVALLADRIG